MARALGDRQPRPVVLGNAGAREDRLDLVVRGNRAAGVLAVVDGRNADGEIGRAHVRTQVTNAHLVCRLLLETQKLITYNESIIQSPLTTIEYKTDSTHPT